MKFSIRDLLWLTVIVALGAGWWIDSRANREAKAALRGQVDALRVDVEALRSDVVTRRVREAELQIELKRAEIENVRLQTK